MLALTVLPGDPIVLTRDGEAILITAEKSRWNPHGTTVAVEAPRSWEITKHKKGKVIPGVPRPPGAPGARRRKLPRDVAADQLRRVAGRLEAVEGRSTRDWGTLDAIREELIGLARSIDPLVPAADRRAS